MSNLAVLAIIGIILMAILGYAMLYVSGKSERQ